MTKTVKKEAFVRGMGELYQDVFGDFGAPSRAKDDVLSRMYDAKGGKDNGYIYYPMGSFITKYMNSSGNYLKVLNILLNYGSYVHQFDVNMYSNKFEVKIGSFKKKHFRFSYNGMANAPANRPIGFIEDHGKAGEDENVVDNS
jgi:hypothetical protein